ncbi:hypothetical protein TEA_026971 [Camellia sinensis var. sinensis]|uniref:NAC domain-containing protein n=1 Tax=Camellia sinensis var. sinensis TaxID=542762 RepID=A0A4S4F1L4_CAMSN|nr:hypothetical protein TEA_026971 [Camellia sinensis var. sinensis]
MFLRKEIGEIGKIGEMGEFSEIGDQRDGRRERTCYCFNEFDLLKLGRRDYGAVDLLLKLRRHDYDLIKKFHLDRVYCRGLSKVLSSSSSSFFLSFFPILVLLLLLIARKNMNTFSHVPPGFRFHPTDEELVDYYLRKKIASTRIDLDVIKDVDLYKIEPWDLQELCKIGTEEQNEWYFFSHKDKKYPTGTRTNRATKAGFWKATGRDKAIYVKHSLIGMRKTLVFYKGRAPNGQKSDWIMHEYRLETNENGTPQASN